MALPFTTNKSLTDGLWTILAIGPTATPVFIEVKAGNVEYAIVPASLGGVDSQVAIPDLDGHHLPNTTSQGIGLTDNTQAFAVKATAGNARISYSGG